jgi:hypothetical protein
MALYDFAFGSSEAGRVLGIPGATIRSWEGRRLIHADPSLSGHHRHLWAIDVFYIGLLREFLAGGFSADNAMATASAVIYGEGRGETELRRELRAAPAPDRIRACQQDYGQVSADVRHRDESSPFWVVYGVGETISAAVLPWPEATARVQTLRHAGCINLTRLLAEIDRELSRLSARRTGRNE